MPKIASVRIDRSDAMAAFCSVAKLAATRDDPEGPLQRILEWLKADQGHLNFKPRDGRVRRLRFGGDGDDFVVLYYHNSYRYKIMKDGCAFVTCADPEDLCELQTKSLQGLIDTILNDELRKAVGRAVSQSGGKFAKMKALDSADGMRTDVIVGIEK